MALTQAEKNEMLNAIKAESQSIDELPVVSSLEGITTLPAIRGTEVVSAPVSLLRKPAEDAARTANAAATNANTAAQAANNAKDAAGLAAVAANTAATQARDAATAANDATSQLQVAIEAARRHPVVLVNDILGDKDRVFADWSAAKDALANLAQSDGEEYMSIGCVMIFRGPKGWESWQFTGDPDNDISDATKWMPFATAGTGSGSGYYNVTALHPLRTGYYTKATAVAKLAEADIDDDHKRGMIITFESAAGKWEDYRFIGTSLSTFTNPGAWEEYGSKNTVRSITVNGEKKTPDAEGNVGITIDEVEVDDSLNASSTNPVQNGVVTAKLSELESGTLFNNEVIENEDGTVTVQLKSKSSVITEFNIPAGGGGGGESAGTKIVLNASLSASTIKEGGSAILTWSYDHQFTGEEAGTSTGQKATVEITVKRGIVTTYSETRQDVSKGTYTLDLAKYLLLGTSDIYVTATTTDPTTGKQQRKPAYVSVKVVSLNLSSSYNVAAGLAQGGYDLHDKVEIPYAVSGAGTKSVILYVDGVQRNLHSVTRSGTTNSNFTLDMAGLSVGRHTVQMVAEMEQDGLTLRSESIYFDILKRGSSAPFIGTKIIHPDGRILTGAAHSVPVIEAGQYEKCTFDFAAYDPSVVPATVELWHNGTLARTVSVPRTAQTYTNRFTEKGRQTLQLKLGSASYTIQVDVAESGIDIGEAQFGLQFKLDAAGRSNDESPDDRAKWESNGITTSFENVDWGSSGWIDGALKLTNGARATIGYNPFATDVKATGLTIEMTMRVSNIMDRTAPVVSCLDKGKGLLITTSEASFRTGQTVTYTNEDDEQVTREIKLATNIVEGEWTKVALTVGTAAQDRLMELYINGNRNGADIYDSSFSFRQDTPQEITIDSTEADIEIKSIRVYNRALSDDEELENRIVDCETTEEMMGEFTMNDILGDNGDVDLDKLRAQGKGVLRIVRKNMLDDVYETNNKKTDFLADVYYYSALGPDYDFILSNCYIRIQGTSSTKYPSKNIRIYFTKGSEKLSMTGKNVLAGNKYVMRPGAVPVPIVCCKSDYSDSSMSLNTGWAKLFNDTMKELGLLTPPQRHQYEQGGNSLAAINVRTAIDGMPIDIFCAETADGENVYYGQYNFNNEKSKSGPVFGMEGVEGFTPECPIALETLNNTSPVCLFSTKTDAELIEKFDGGAEVNYGVDSAGKVQTDGDVKWAGLSTKQQQAILRLHSWLRSCVPAGATSSNLSTYVSPKFKAEIDRYFDKDFILTYYIDREYGLGVDQFAKNMILRTWDGLIWYITYYDGDTQLGKRNDCFLVPLHHHARHMGCRGRQIRDGGLRQRAVEPRAGQPPGRPQTLRRQLPRRDDRRARAVDAQRRAERQLERPRLQQERLPEIHRPGHEGHVRQGVALHLRPAGQQQEPPHLLHQEPIRPSRRQIRHEQLHLRQHRPLPRQDSWRRRRHRADHGQRALRLRVRHQQQPQHRQHRHRGCRRHRHPRHHRGLYRQRPPASLRSQQDKDPRHDRGGRPPQERPRPRQMLRAARTQPRRAAGRRLHRVVAVDRELPSAASTQPEEPGPGQDRRQHEHRPRPEQPDKT